MNDQPPHPTPHPIADPTADPAVAAPVSAGADPTAVPLPAAPPVAPEWSGEPGSAWGAPFASQPGPAYGAQPAPAYGPAQPGAYPGYPGAWNPPAPAPGSGGTSGFAIASLVFGIFGGVLLSTIFGLVALAQIRKRGKTGRGLAIAGLTFSGCWILVIVVAVTFAILTDSGNDSTNSASGNADPTIAVTLLKPGNCVNGIQTSGSIADLPIVSCADPHEGEVYAVFTLPDGAWPGVTTVQKQAEKRCQDELETFAPNAADTVEVFYLHPVQRTWPRDRGVTCLATDSRGKTTGTVGG